ncbi:hypothetical protein BV394_05375 [Brevirhabdus pacifica]|uniref:Uncharacterized protein n=1 Tax=Brevirhabdus pacifica TaxID=1267768 RepID=A0A1U7DH01_9RHOB|nr:hypothetical protein [Brevirhabdus pacifica]APX89215.1 hypothetical protein BV394_05375 [Brevirhabdus pacifica]OWU76738.1 hypothetical protein ATO5_10910 [Loktanella sp. 22II-4b]PJJ86180.1 hypothetical protein CLV77_0715 [Brevirhabdus pacifica]
MKRLSILVFALTAICAAGGYGLGVVMSPDADAAQLADGGSSGMRDGADGLPEDQIARAIVAEAETTHEEAIPEDDGLVKLGRITVPVYRSRSVTYIVADFGVTLADATQAKTWRKAENAARLRDSILASMHEAARSSQLTDPAAVQERLSQRILSSLDSKFEGIKEVRFLEFYQGDVPLI